MIEIRNLHKVFRSGDRKVVGLREVSLQIKAGEFFVLLGSSGSGKTTLLRCIAGLERPDGGEIILGDRVVYSAEKRINVRPEKRRLGMVFQSYAIWPHMTVYDNVARPLQEGWLKLPKSQVPDRVHQALTLVGMEEMASRPAPFLSGGQQQRVALARSLAMEPSVLLMDEPLSNLDARLREEVRGEIKSLAKRVGVTVVYVTHDQAEAMDLADRVAVLRHGDVAQVAPPEEIYLKPADSATAQFMGSMNLLPGEASSDGYVITGIGRIHAPVNGASAVVVGIRPQSIRLQKFDNARNDQGANSPNVFPGTIVTSSFLGDSCSYTVQVADGTLKVDAPWDTRLEGKVLVTLAEEGLCVFDSVTGKRHPIPGTAHDTKF
jgi:iron(III) transport system ATP-binding protein